MICVRKKYVYSSKLRRRIKRCAKFSGGRRRRRGRISYSSRSRRRRGKRPFNKGRTCVAWGMVYNRRAGRSVRVCKSYGSRSAWRMRRGGSRPPTMTMHSPFSRHIVSAAPSSARYVPSRVVHSSQVRPTSWLHRLLGSG